MSKYKRIRGIRKKVFYKEKGICRSCGYQHDSPNSLDYECDHIKPLSLGGENDLDNLQLLCTDCHRKKTKHDRAQWYQRKYKNHVRKYPFNREWIDSIQAQYK